MVAPGTPRAGVESATPLLVVISREKPRFRHVQPLQPAQTGLEERVNAETDEPESDDAEQNGAVPLMGE